MYVYTSKQHVYLLDVARQQVVCKCVYTSNTIVIGSNYTHLHTYIQATQMQACYLATSNNYMYK